MKKLTAKQIIARKNSLKSARSNWETHWQELTDFVIPDKNDILSQRNDGEKTNNNLLDNTAIQSCELLAGALHGMLTNPNAIFFELTTGDEEIDSDKQCAEWLQLSARQMHQVLNDSNFQTEIHEVYLDLCSVGTAPLSMEEDDEQVVNFTARHVKDVFVSENSRGYINEAYRTFLWNARQIVEEFGEKNIGKKVAEAYKKGTEEKFELIHAVYPCDIDKEKKKKAKWEFYSQYVIVADEMEVESDEDGFNEFPYVIPRWSKKSNELYGRCPGMTALPEAKMINTMMETMIKAAQLTVAPPLQLPDDGFILPIKTKPFGLNYYRAGTEDRIEPIFQKDIRIDFGDLILEKTRQRIREAFYVDQLQLGTGPQMTATEVNARTEEKVRLLGPMLGRQQSELLQPLIARVFGIMMRKGKFKPMPEKLLEYAKTKGLGVRYSSMIARAQRLSEGQNILRTVEAIAPFVNVDPTIMDNVKGDEVFNIVGRIYGFPQKAVRDPKEVTQMRQGRAAAQQAAMQAKQQQDQVDQASKVLPAVAQLQRSGGQG